MLSQSGYQEPLRSEKIRFVDLNRDELVRTRALLEESVREVRSFLLEQRSPPGTPEDRLSVLRKGLENTLKDMEFLQDAKKLGVDIEPSDAKRTQNLVEKMFATPAPIVARIQAAMAQ